MWWPSHQEAGRSQPGQRQCWSRALSARRLGPLIVRSARPTSITSESCIRTLVRLQSQAQRSTVFEEMGSENSLSAPGAPVRSSKVSIELVTCIWIFLLVAGQLDQGVSHPLRSQAVVVFAQGSRQRLQRAAHHRPADGVEEAGQKERAVVSPVHVQGVGLRQLGLLLGVLLGVDRVPVVEALVVELARRVLAGERKQLEIG